MNPLLPGSDWALQARAQFTRADGTLNRSGYFSEIRNCDISSSDDSDSDSGSSSDCIIISPSSFTGKPKNTCRDLVVAGLAPIKMETSSKYTNIEIVKCFREMVKLSGSGDKSGIITEPEGEFVTTVNTNPPHYFYMYTSVIQLLNIWLPFTPFEVSMLRTLNVAPSQLHPNSWAFIKAFEARLSKSDQSVGP
ncbi:hypothetical protein L195_g036042 [Trifolium pratense]|uniref:Uncharacterized protein n=1 Tax=Trifolium pratense TaxID=57577 RepID=A0A2K3LNF2_TRIPR|nr:hypothetical protein L195_g036042 [Trifolium pratense]